MSITLELCFSNFGMEMAGIEPASGFNPAKNLYKLCSDKSERFLPDNVASRIEQSKKPSSEYYTGYQPNERKLADAPTQGRGTH